MIRTIDDLVRDEKAYIHEEYRKEFSGFNTACHYGYREDIQDLLERMGAAAIKENSASGVPLVAACMNGQKEIVELLLNNGLMLMEVT